MDSLPEVILVSNAKCIDGTPVSFDCFLKAVYITEIKNHTCVIKCGGWEQEINLDQIREYVKE